jgi:probable phosphoglycerate mutase
VQNYNKGSHPHLSCRPYPPEIPWQLWSQEQTNSLAMLGRQSNHRFYIIRHGETDANAADVIQGSCDVSRLTERGRAQAQSIYDALVRMTNNDYHGELIVSSIYCSPLTRARDTLSILRKSYEDARANSKATVGLPTHDIILKNLREIDFYGWEQVQKEELKANFPAEYQAWKEGDPHGLIVDDCYPLLEVWKRATEVWKEIRGLQPKKQDNRGVHLLVCHGTLGQALLSTAFGIDATAFRRNTFPNCGIAEIHWHRDRDLATAWRWVAPPPESIQDECDITRPIAAYDLGCLREQLADIVLEDGGSLP